MSIVLNSSGGGSITIQEPSTASNFTQTLPASTGTVVTTGSPQSGSVLQVVQAYKTDSFTGNTSNAYIDITGLSLSITPKFSTSKILVLGNLAITTVNAKGGAAILVRNSTTIGQADSASNRARSSGAGSGFTGDGAGDNLIVLLTNFCYLDNPATTSATTYKIQGAAFDSIWYVNRSQTDGDTGDSSRWTSNITVMEIAA